MSQSVKLSEELLRDARQHAGVYSRSVAKQIEYWSRIGKIAEENPDLSYDMIREIMLARAEAAEGDVSPYTFG